MTQEQPVSEEFRRLVIEASLRVQAALPGKPAADLTVLIRCLASAMYAAAHTSQVEGTTAEKLKKLKEHALKLMDGYMQELAIFEAALNSPVAGPATA